MNILIFILMGLYAAYVWETHKIHELMREENNVRNQVHHR